MVKFFILAIGFLSSLFCYADDYYDSMYQQCKEDESDLVQKFTENVQDNYCLPLSKGWPQCLSAYNTSESCPLPITIYDHINDLYEDLLEANQMQNLKGLYNIPSMCFLASTSLKGSFTQPSNFYQCHNDNTSINEPAPCANKEYIDLITKAFNRMANCFGFVTRRDKGILFALLHHESRFLLNKAEESGEKEDANRCFGQMDNDFVSDLNKYIQFGIGRKGENGQKIKGLMSKPEPVFEKYGDIYKNAHKKCPFLEKALVPHTNELKNTDLIGPPGETSFDKKHEERKNKIICKTSQDPYPCLFYTMYGMRVSLNMVDELLSNSTLTSLIIGGKSYRIFDKNDTTLRWVVAIWAHNAGKNGIIKRAFPDFIKTLKDETVKSYDNCTISQCKKDIVSSLFLSTLELVNKFKDYALEDKDGDGKFDNDVSNATEVSEIIHKIQNDLGSFKSKSNDVLRKAMRDLPLVEENPRNGQIHLNGFLENVQGYCSFKFLD